MCSISHETSHAAVTSGEKEKRREKEIVMDARNTLERGRTARSLDLRSVYDPRALSAHSVLRRKSFRANSVDSVQSDIEQASEIKLRRGAWSVARMLQNFCPSPQGNLPPPPFTPTRPPPSPHPHPHHTHPPPLPLSPLLCKSH